MGSVAHFTDLRSGVVDALRLLAESTAGQSVIRVGADACEVEWDPGARHHHALLLPLVLLTAAIDEGAARARWQGVGFAQAVGVAHRLDTIEKGMLLALAGRDGAVDFAAELAAWIDRFGLDGAALEVDRERLDRGDKYGVRPVRPMRDMPGVLKPFPYAHRPASCDPWSRPIAWCRGDAPRRAGPPRQLAMAGRLTWAVSLRGPMVSRVM